MLWLLILLAIIVAVGALLWWTVGQPTTEPQAPLLPGYFGPNDDVLEVDRELRRAARRGGADGTSGDEDA